MSTSIFERPLVFALSESEISKASNPVSLVRISNNADLDTNSNSSQPDINLTCEQCFENANFTFEHLQELMNFYQVISIEELCLELFDASEVQFIKYVVNNDLLSVQQAQTLSDCLMAAGLLHNL